MTREEFYKLTDILNTEVLGNFMHGGEADELIAMFEEAVEHSNILEQEETSEELEKAAWIYYDKNKPMLPSEFALHREFVDFFEAGAKWQEKKDQSTIELAEDHAMLAGMEKMREQMMKNAVNASIYRDGEEKTLHAITSPISNVEFGEKVKVIVIKQE